jgi:hypothetical protein
MHDLVSELSCEVDVIRDFFDPTPEQEHVMLIDAATLRKAEKLIDSCEGCNQEGAEIPFDNILDRVTASDPSVTDYILEAPAKCPNCRREIFEKTRVEPPDVSPYQPLINSIEKFIISR